MKQVERFVVVELQLARYLGEEVILLAFVLQLVERIFGHVERFSILDSGRDRFEVFVAVEGLIRLCKPLADLLLSFHQAFQKKRVERAAFAIEDHLNGFFVTERWLVDAF